MNTLISIGKGLAVILAVASLVPGFVSFWMLVTQTGSHEVYMRVIEVGMRLLGASIITGLITILAESWVED